VASVPRWEPVLRHERAPLDLLVGLLADDDHHGTDGTLPPAVIPVVYDSLDSDRELLEAAFRHFSAQLFYADPMRTAVPGTPSADLLALVRDVCSKYPLDIVLEASAGEVRATAADPANLNESHKVLLSTIALLLSDEVASVPLSVLGFPTTILDSTRLALLWELLVHQAPDQLARDIRTFVPLLHGPVSIRDHCSGQPSARWIVRRGYAHRRRHDAGALQGQVTRLVGDLSRPLVLFLGAGASASARLPQGNAVRDQAIQRLLGGGGPASELGERFRTWVIEEHRLLPEEDAMDKDTFLRLLTLERVLHEEFLDLLARILHEPAAAPVVGAA